MGDDQITPFTTRLITALSRRSALPRMAAALAAVATVGGQPAMAQDEAQPAPHGRNRDTRARVGAGGASITVYDSGARLIPSDRGAAVSAFANCAAGEQVVSGGFQLSDFTSAAVVESYRKSDTQWAVTAVRTQRSSTDATVTAFAYCAES
jgi:hypothetical protein